MGDGIRVERRDSVVWLLLDRPERANAVTADMIAALQQALDEVNVDDATRVVVLSATGEHFCSGVDLAPINAADLPPPRPGRVHRAMSAGSNRLLATLEELEVPVVAGVRGTAAGFGCALALACDYVVAARSACFWTPFVERGFSPDSGTTALLPRLVGMARAKEMLLFGRKVDGPTAATWGLVNESVDDADLDGRLEAVAANAAGSATVALGLARTLVNRNATAGLREAMVEEGLAVELSIRSRDFKEALAAFREKRPPDFEGR